MVDAERGPENTLTFLLNSVLLSQSHGASYAAVWSKKSALFDMLLSIELLMAPQISSANLQWIFRTDARNNVPGLHDLWRVPSL